MKRVKAALKKSRSMVIALATALFAVLSIISMLSVKYWTKQEVGAIIAQDIAKLSAIFKRIEQTCNIIGFDDKKNPINFLTIKKNGFVGSEVGSMNLAHPEKWEGPYVSETMTMQGHAYQIISTHRGYFIVPGEGVTLPNGKTIGKELILNQDTDIDALMGKPEGLMYKKQPLAAPLNISFKSAERQILSEELA